MAWKRLSHGQAVGMLFAIGITSAANANLPDYWWRERAFEVDMKNGPRSAPFHAQLELTGTPEPYAMSAAGHCLVTAVVRRLFKGSPSLKVGAPVILRAYCKGLTEENAPVPINGDDTTAPLQGLIRGQLIEAYFHTPMEADAYFVTRLRVIRTLSNTPKDPLPH